MANNIDFKIELSDADLTRIGLKGAQLIQERTEKGLDADGNPFEPYSENAFAMPLGAITARARQALGDKLNTFTTKKGALWAVIEGGYKAFKSAAYPQDSGSVNMTQTGRMMSGLTVVRTDPTTNTVVLGFTQSEDALKAWYHNEAGAGPRKVIRKFLGWTDEEKVELAGMSAAMIVLKA